DLDQLLTSLITSVEGISDLLFVAGKPPQAEVHGRLGPVASVPEPMLNSDRIESLAGTIINENKRLLEDLVKAGSCDCSYSLTGICRFRVNIYRQNGNYAMVLRRLSSQIPTMEKLRLAPVFHEIIKEKNGLVFVTGGTGSGKTTTLAALLNEVNQNSEFHVVTLEDPVEFLHPQLKCTFSQREMGRDFYSFPDGLRAALRQAPKIILVGEIRDRETMEIALTAGETGHVVYSTLHTISAGQTINRILGMFSRDEEQQVRERLAGSLRYIVSQRLVPKREGGRMLVTELMGSSLRSREAMLIGENENRRFSDIIEAGVTMGWHSFEQSLIKAYEEDLITEESAMLYSINKSLMRQRTDAVNKRGKVKGEAHSLKMAHVPAAVPPPRPAMPPPKPPQAPAAPQ
ncbi:MAG TPA: PilT/PilU family type 4a pilus ATPase, partial [Verrucomicrobiae bacterium]|nr:PilT/PilU family type 4a pilus ATPase [Verrucomicrobiae bacterium]